MSVDDGNLFYIFKIRSIFRAIGGIHNRFDGEFYIIGGERFSVVPRYIFLEMKSVGTGGAVEFPVSGETGDDFVISVVCRETVEKQEVDLTVFIHGRVDPGVVAAAVDERGGVF